MQTLATATHSRHRAASGRRSPGWWMPWLFVAGLGLVVSVNAVMIWLAIDSFSGLDTENPYERGLSYNQTIAAVQAQGRLGWRVTLDAAASRPEGLSPSLDIEAQFQDHVGAELDDLAVRAVLVRPAVEGHDVKLPLIPLGGGRYAGSADLPLRGQWELRIVAEGGGASWQSSRRVLVP